MKLAENIIDICEANKVEWEKRHDGSLSTNVGRKMYNTFEPTKMKNYPYDNPKKGWQLKYSMPSDSQYWDVGVGGNFATLKDVENYILGKKYKLAK